MIDIENKNCLIIHGCPSEVEDRLCDKHWLAWVRKELIANGIKTETPSMPEAWHPDYEKFKIEFENYEVNENTVLVGHSCGCAFLLRWLGETKRRAAKLILVAPWKIGDDDFYNYDIDQSIKERVGEIVIFTADDEEDDGKLSAKIFQESISGRVIELAGHGHYTLEDMVTEEFPELIEIVLS